MWCIWCYVMIVTVTCMHISCVNFCVHTWFWCRVELYVFCLGVLTYNAMLQAFEHGCKYICLVLVSSVHYPYVWVFFFLAQLSMSKKEKRYRNKIIITIISFYQDIQLELLWAMQHWTSSWSVEKWARKGITKEVLSAHPMTFSQGKGH